MRAYIGIVLLLGLLAAQGAVAYPGLWASKKTAPNGCLLHPTTAADDHGAPVPDTTTKYVVTDASGKAVKSVSRGKTYTVKVNFGAPRLSLTTVSAGKISGDVGCPNRYWTAKSQKGATATFPWTIPAGAKGSLVIKTTSNNSPSGAFQAASASFPVA